MKKKIKTILAVVVIAIIVVSALLFFVVFREEKSRFIGTWDYTMSVSEDNLTFNWTITFYENDTAKTETLVSYDQGDDEGFSWNKYTINDGKLCFDSENEIPEGFEHMFPNIETDEFSKECYNYEFSNGDETLTLTSEEYTFVFTKQ